MEQPSRMVKFSVLLAMGLLFLPSGAMAEEKPAVVVSIKPLHSLVAGVTRGTDITPVLLVDGKASLHEFSLKPSQAKALNSAGIVFYMGDGFELFLGKALKTLPEKTQRVPMERAKGMVLYPIRHAQDGDHDHDHGAGPDLHLWLSPQNARAMLAEIVRALIAKYPKYAPDFIRNAEQVDYRLATLDKKLQRRMGILKNRPFAVFHDAYQYFDRTYGLRNVGAITLHPEQAPGAKRLQTLRDRVMDMKVLCVFREPQYDARIVDNMVSGTGAHSAVLDPEGALLTPGPNLYFELMEGIAGGLEKCLN